MRRDFGIVGTGGIARVHAQAIQGIPGARLVACCDTVAERAERFAREFGGRPYSELEAFVAHPGLEIVTVSTPSGAHLDPAVRAAGAGKHLIVEKPLEVTTERCDQIIAAAEASRVLCAGVFPSRFYPGPRRLQRAVAEGRFGRLVTGDACVKWYRSQEYYDASGWRGTWRLDGGGALMNQAIHSVDLLQWIMGPVESVQAFTGTLGHERIEVEDVAAAAVRFASGALGLIEATTAAFPGFEPRLEVVGTQGSAVLRDKDIEAWVFAQPAPGDEAAVTRPRSDPGAASSANDPAAVDIHGHLEQFRDMVDALDAGRQPTLGAREARKSVAIVTAIYQSAREGRPVVVT